MLNTGHEQWTGYNLIPQSNSDSDFSAEELHNLYEDEFQIVTRKSRFFNKSNYIFFFLLF